MISQLRLTGVVLLTLASSMLAGSAHAEGRWTSWIGGARVGFESRSWHDNNSDNVNTKITFSTCRDSTPFTDPNDWADVRLYREIRFRPDAIVGTKRLYCWNSASGFYGDVEEGDYHFTITDYSGPNEDWNTLDVRAVEVVY